MLLVTSRRWPGRLPAENRMGATIAGSPYDVPALKKSDFNYDLPAELIAQDRDATAR